MTKNTKTQANGNQSVDVVIYRPRAGAPANKLADVALRFNNGLLRGTKLVGFTVWKGEKATGGEVLAVTAPSQKNGDRYYDWLRGDLKFLKAVITKAYRKQAEAWEAGEASDVDDQADVDAA